MIKTFICKRNSEIYNNYFTQLKEHEKYRKLMCGFLNKYKINCDEYYIINRLVLKLNYQEIMRLNDQICKNSSGEQAKFKIKSEFNQSYMNEVYNKIDANNLYCNKYWTWGCFTGKLKFDMWDFNGNIYGFMEGDCIEKLPEGTIKISNSKYYQAYANAVKYWEDKNEMVN